MANDSEVSVKISADVSGLEAGASQASDSADTISDKLRGIKDAAAEGGAGLDQAGESAGGFASALGSMGEVAAGVFGGLELGKISEEFKSFFEDAIFGASALGEKLSNLSLSTGISTETLERLRYAAQLSGTDFDALQRSVSQLSLKMLDLQSGGTNKKLETAMADLGLTPEQLSDSEHAIDNIAAAITRVGISQRTIGDVSEILGGRGGARMIPMLEMLDEANRKFAENNQAIGTDNVEALQKSQEAINEAGAAWDRLKTSVGEAAAGPLTDFFEILTKIITGLHNFAAGTGEIDAIKKRLDEYGESALTAYERDKLAQAAAKAEGDATAAAWQGAKAAMLDFQTAHAGAAAGSDSNVQKPTDKWDAPTPDVGLPAPPSNDTFSPDTKVADVSGAQKAALQQEIEDFKAAEEMKRALAGDTAQARMASEQAVHDFLVSKETDAADIGIDLNKQVAASALNLVRDQIAASKAGDKESGFTGDQAAALGFPSGAESLRAIEDTIRIAKAGHDQLYAMASADADQMTALQTGKDNLLRAQIEQQAQLGIITQSQANAQLAALDQQDAQNKEASVKAKIASLIEYESAEAGTAAKLEKLYTELFKIEDAATVKSIQNQTKAAIEFQKPWETAFGAIGNSFNQVLGGIFQGTQTLQGAMQHAAQSIALTFIQYEGQRLLKSLATEAAIVAAHLTGNAAMSASDATTAAGGLGSLFSSAIKIITGDAATAAANTYAQVSQIPVVGWILAPVAAAAAFTAVAGYEALVPSAAGGMVVGSDFGFGARGVIAHPDEMILPADLSKGLQNVIAQQDGSGGGSTRVEIHINAVDQRGVRAFFDEHAGHVERIMTRALRNAA